MVSSYEICDFTPIELDLLLCGKADIDAEEMAKRHKIHWRI